MATRADRIWTVADLTTAAVSSTDMNLHLRVDGNDEDALVDAFAHAATLAVEKYTGRILVRREAVLRLPCLPHGRTAVDLPGGVVGSVTSMTVDGVAFTAFEVIGNSPALMVPAQDWPVTVGEGYPVTVTYQCGPENVPADLAVAVKMLASEMFERRSNASEATLMTVPLSAQALMAPHRIYPR